MYSCLRRVKWSYFCKWMLISNVALQALDGTMNLEDVANLDQNLAFISTTDSWACIAFGAHQHNLEPFSCQMYNTIMKPATPRPYWNGFIQILQHSSLLTQITSCVSTHHSMWREHRRSDTGDWVLVPKYRSPGCRSLPKIYVIQKAKCPKMCEHGMQKDGGVLTRQETASSTDELWI